MMKIRSEALPQNLVLHSKILGEGPPLVIVHGLFGAGENWMSFAKRWQNQYTVHLLDLRNHGDSFHDAHMDYENMSRDLKHYLDHHKISRMYTIGHSMGGKVVMQFSREYPQYLIKMVVVDMAPKVYEASSQDEVFRGLFSVDLDKLKRKYEAFEVMREHIDSDVVVQFLLKSLRRLEGGTYRWIFNLQTLRDSYPKLSSFQPLQSKSIETPTLFIRGGASDYVTDGDIRNLKQSFKRVRVETIQGAGHWVHSEKPSEFFDRVDPFLSS